MDDKPDCYKCVHKGSVPGSAHTRCNNFDAKVSGDSYGVKMGWFMWPLNFDPTWLTKCDGFSDKPEDRKSVQKLDPLLEILAMLR